MRRRQRFHPGIDSALLSYEFLTLIYLYANQDISPGSGDEETEDTGNGQVTAQNSLDSPDSGQGPHPESPNSQELHHGSFSSQGSPHRLATGVLHSNHLPGPARQQESGRSPSKDCSTSREQRPRTPVFGQGSTCCHPKGAGRKSGNWKSTCLICGKGNRPTVGSYSPSAISWREYRNMVRQKPL